MLLSFELTDTSIILMFTICKFLIGLFEMEAGEGIPSLSQDQTHFCGQNRTGDVRDAWMQEQMVIDMETGQENHFL